jgi:hypothetical protein
VVALGLAASTLIATGLASAVPDPKEVGVLAPGTLRAFRAYGQGPTAIYQRDVGKIGGVLPLDISLPPGGAYDVIVSLSFNYRTKGTATFVIGVDAREGSLWPSGSKVDVSPAERPLHASPLRSATTLMFRMTDLAGGTDYWLTPYVNAYRSANARLLTHTVLMVVDATPSA